MAGDNHVESIVRSFLEMLLNLNQGSVNISFNRNQKTDGHTIQDTLSSRVIETIPLSSEEPVPGGDWSSHYKLLDDYAN